MINAIRIKPTVSTANLKNSISVAFMRNAQIEGEHQTVASDAAGAVTLDGKVGTLGPKASRPSASRGRRPASPPWTTA